MSRQCLLKNNPINPTNRDRKSSDTDETTCCSTSMTVTIAKPG